MDNLRTMLFDGLSFLFLNPFCCHNDFIYCLMVFCWFKIFHTKMNNGTDKWTAWAQLDRPGDKPPFPAFLSADEGAPGSS